LHRLKSSDKGVAIIESIAPGRYSIAAEFQGFGVALLRSVTAREIPLQFDSELIPGRDEQDYVLARLPAYPRTGIIMSVRRVLAADTRSTTARRNAESREPVTRGTGNVFADLGFPDAAERQSKLRLAYALNQVLQARKLSQADAAKVLGVTQPKVSALRHYKLAGFSVERLMNLLTALDQDVEIVIRRNPRSRKGGRITVVAA